MNRYFFNFRKGDELSCDRVGMYLPNLDAAREEATYVSRELIQMAQATGEAAEDCEIQIADAGGDVVLAIPLGERHRLH